MLWFVSSNCLLRAQNISWSPVVSHGHVSSIQKIDEQHLSWPV